MTGMAYRSEAVTFPASYEVSSKLVGLGLEAIILMRNQKSRSMFIQHMEGRQ